MAEDRKDPRYYNSDKLPLLMQGFEQQFTNTITQLIDKKEFTSKVDRGVINYLDFQCISLNQVANGMREVDFNGTLLTVLAGGQQILVDEPAEQFDYAIDLGDRIEQRVQVVINGGQTLESKMYLPDLTSNAPGNVALVGQLLAHYTTKKHEEWLRSPKSQFNWGLGLKRQSYKTRLLAGATSGTTLEVTVPKNQGRVIGFSILIYGTDISETYVDVSFDDLTVNLNVLAMRFSRFVQRDPFIQKIDVEPGATLQFTLRPKAGYAMINDLFGYITLHFGN